MVINLQFQNLNQANSEILRAFNSANSAKALEAYQPLSAKERKLHKLRALQALKESSASKTLADISLSTDSLTLALTKAEGATLQAMLNLLSAKMIEQNKYTYFKEDEQQKLKTKVQDKLDQYQEDRDEPEEDDQSEQGKSTNIVDELVDAAAEYFNGVKEEILEQYSKVLSAFSLKNLRSAFDEGLKIIKEYAYEVPVESFKEYVINPINEFSDDVRSFIDDNIRDGLLSKSKRTFSPKEIRAMLKNSLLSKSESKLDRSIIMMNNSLKARAQVRLANKGFSHKDVKVALHNA